jgi:hypothetical protein
MQIGRQLNRNTPKLDSEGYSEGLKDLIAFALDSNPASRPTMADILAHPYIADTDEEYPTSSVSELVRNYYQWSQRGGQRISLFHPGGAAAAELPGTEESEDDWNFSTTDGFERRFSVIDLDQIAASLAEMEEAISPTTPLPDHDSNEEVSDTDMDPEQKANFDERVRRGAAAMEGLFDEEKPSYKYETKNDFVPIQPPQPISDLPLRTETDRSSVTSTFIDIDIGSFDSSHYAAGAPSAQPFQLADADTIRANRSSIRSHRNSNENSSQSSSSDAEGSDSREDNFQPPSGPRPPTMDWKFPGFMLPEEEAAKEAPKEAPAPDPVEERSFQAEKRATMEWTFPVMSNQQDETSANDEPERHDTLRAPIIPPKQQPAEEPIISRPSTSASHNSTMSDSDYDPFRFDRPATPPGVSPQPNSSFNSEFPTLTESTDDDSELAGLLDGPGPDEEEETPMWHEHNDVVSEDDVPPLPTAIPVHGSPGGTAPSVSEPGSPIYVEPLQTARREFMSEVSTLRNSEPGAISFPVVLPPSMESLMEGADDATITAELDRLLGDFLGALSATGEALSRTIPENHRTDDSAHVGEKV